MYIMDSFDRLKKSLSNLNEQEDLAKKWSKLKGKNISIAEAIQLEQAAKTEASYGRVRREAEAKQRKQDAMDEAELYAEFDKMKKNKQQKQQKKEE